MKRFIFFIAFTLSMFSAHIFAQDSLTNAESKNSKEISSTLKDGNDSLSARVAELYNEGHFSKVIELLETEKEKQAALGLESADVFYNLGNAYFRTNEIAKAILYYEKALLIKPGDRDIRHNIEYVNTKIEDKILVADTFFLHVWFRGLQNLLSSNTWATIAITSFLIFMGCITLFFFSQDTTRKKVAFYVGLVLIIFVVFANIFSFKQKNKIEHRQSAIIMTGTAPIHSSPDMNSKELFILHSGTKVYITKDDRNWLEIEIDNGNVGWIQREKIEII